MPSAIPVQVQLDGVTLARLVGESKGGSNPSGAVPELVMSRFALVRRDGDAMIAETALGPAAVVLEDPRAHVFLATFVVLTVLDEALAERVHLPISTVRELGVLLWQAEVLVERAQADAEHRPPLAVWEHHDLLFHARSRGGRQRNPGGGTYRFLGRLDPPAALPPERWTHTIALPRPDYEALERQDPPLTEVQGRRSSIRHYDDQPLSLTQLSEFLYRVGRLDDYLQFPLPTTPPTQQSFAVRPYPSAGSSYELELYVAVMACRGLEPGLYHYDAGAHRLARVATDTEPVRGLIRRAGFGMGIEPATMQSLVTITARFARVAWKYDSIAYALVLKNVGVLLQTMYLAATAMDLAPCAIGSGDSDLFARASEIDYYEEAAVGEFALGNRPGQGAGSR